MINLERVVDDLFKDINKIRSNPQHYGASLAKKQSLYSNDIYRPQGKFIQTKEGVNALRDAAVQLQRAPRLPPLTWSFALHVLADEQALNLGSTGAVKGDKPLSDRIPKYALATGKINEIIELSGTSSEEILHELIVDDGLVTRRRRKALLDPVYKHIGIAAAKHKTYGYITVLIFAEQIHELLKPTNELVQLEANKGQRKQVDPNVNYYKMKKPPVYNQLKHFKRSHVIIPPPPPPPPPAIVRSLKNSQVNLSLAHPPPSPQQFVQPIIQQHEVEVIQPIMPPALIQTPVFLDPHPHPPLQTQEVMLTSMNRSTRSVQGAPQITSIPPNPNYEVMYDPRYSSDVGLIVTHPPTQQALITDSEAYRRTIIQPPQHMRMINRLSQIPMHRLPEATEQNPGICQKCSNSACLLF